MVCSTVTEDQDVVKTIEVSSAMTGVPSGDYRLVGWDMDATGKRLVDEICQIAAYTTGSAYSQYVMPFKNLSPPAKKRHCIKVVTMGRYRVLKSSITNKPVPTKSEISALVDFLGWLEKVKGDASDGVILVHHEPRKVNPSMLIEALTKYNLLDRFRETVKGFANGFEIAKTKYGNSLKGYSLRILSRVCLDQEDELNSAANRARLAYQIVHHLSRDEQVESQTNEDGGSGDSDATTKATVEYIKDFTQSLSVVEKEYAALKVVLAIQNTLKPIFNPLLGMARRERQHASRLRRLLAESGIDFKQLQEAWDNDKLEGVKKLVEKVVAEEKEIADLIEVLDCHFDPEKTLPVPTYEEKKKSKKIRSEKNKRAKENGNNDVTREKENVKNDVTTTEEESDKNHVTTTEGQNDNNNVTTTEKDFGKTEIKNESPDTTTCDSPVDEKDKTFKGSEIIKEVDNETN